MPRKKTFIDATYNENLEARRSMISFLFLTSHVSLLVSAKANTKVPVQSTSHVQINN